MVNRSYQDGCYDTGCPTIDVHYCSVDIALRMIQKEIVRLVKQGIYYFEVIHGYNKGSYIRDAIYSRRIKSKRIQRIAQVPRNDGRSGIYLRGGVVK